MKLRYDPAEGMHFWESIGKIPGYPQNEIMPIKHMLFEADALFKTSDILKSVGADLTQPLLIVWDTTPMRRGNDNLKELIADTLRAAGWQLKIIVMEADKNGQVHTDMPHIDQVKTSLSNGCAVLSVGSGVVTDIAKHGCYLYQTETGERPPYVVFQTANSVSAFTSNKAPTFIDNVKRTLNSRYPDAVICDLETLRDAPMWMTISGVGDMLAPFVSLPDWYLAYRFNIDSTYTRFVHQLLGPLDEIFLDEAEGIKKGNLNSVAALSKIISLGGLAMSISDATTPLSGLEHVISHTLDLQAEVADEPLAPHGSQVALAVVIGLEIYRHFLNEFDPIELNLDSCFPSSETMRILVMKNYATIDASGKAGAECWADYRQKLAAWHKNREGLSAVLKDWPNIRARLEEDIRPTERLVQILTAIDAPLTWDKLSPPTAEHKVKFAYMNASFMRNRLTIGDLLIFFNWDREALWQRIWKRTQLFGK